MMVGKKCMISLLLIFFCVFSLCGFSLAYAQENRLKTGTYIKDADRTGYGELSITNGMYNDAVAMLTTLENKTILSVYIRGNNDNFTISGIQDGDYYLYFTSGQGWNSSLKEFEEDADYSMLNSTLNYVTKEDKEGILYTSNTLKLKVVTVPSGSTVVVTQSNVPKMNFPPIA